jgi:hypothetical protein
MGKRRRELDKLTHDWHVLNSKNSQASQPRMQHTLPTTGTEDTEKSTHKHQSYTVKGPARVSTQTEYFGAPRGSLTTSSAFNSSNMVSFNYEDLLDSIEDHDSAVYNEHLAETSLEVNLSRRNRHLGVSKED